MEEKKILAAWRSLFKAHTPLVLALIITLIVCIYTLINIKMVGDEANKYWLSEMIKHNCIVPKTKINPYFIGINYTNLYNSSQNYGWQNPGG